MHFTPTERARAKLLAEGIREEMVFVAGNTVVDYLFMILERTKGQSHLPNLPIQDDRRLTLCHGSSTRELWDANSRYLPGVEEDRRYD